LPKENGDIMFKVLNEDTEEIITEFSEYEDAVNYMNQLNKRIHQTRIARNWYNNRERELYKDVDGNKEYGVYVIVTQ
jgi:hypothetical protein